jgi:hypothetical protein
MEMQQGERLDQIEKEGRSSPTSPGSSGKKGVSTWLKNRFSRRMSRGQKSTDAKDTISSPVAAETSPAFVGGAALTGASQTDLSPAEASHAEAHDEEEEEEEEEEDAESEVDTERPGRTKKRATSISSASEAAEESEAEQVEADDLTSGEDDFVEARDNFDEGLAPPPKFVAPKNGSPARDSKFKEVM